MRTHIPVGAGALGFGGFLLFCGCAVSPPPSQVDRDWGVSHRLAVYGQIANLDAENHLEPVMGIDGKAALGTLSRQRGSFGYVPGMDLPTEFTKQYQIERANQAAAPKIFIDVPADKVAAPSR